MVQVVLLLRKTGGIEYDSSVSIGSHIKAWRVSRKLSVSALASQAGLSVETLEAMEVGDHDPLASSLESVASALSIPTPWLYAHPKHLELLTTDGDGDDLVSPSRASADPVLDQILAAVQQGPELYVLLTSILQGGDPKLLRAADASLRSLAKQSRRASLPWESRIPGHFEPPTD